MDESDIKKLLCIWLTLPLTLLDWWITWDHLADRVVMKSDANGRPTHWATRGEAMKFDLMLMGSILVFITLLSALGLATDDEKGRHLYFTALLVCAIFVFLIVNGILWFVQAA